MRVLLALGGNAMTAPDGRATPAAQIAAVEVAMRAAARLVAAGHELVVTHGNGPQVGNLLVKNELAAHVVPPVPLDWCGAQTQGTLGFTILDALDGALAALGRRPARGRPRHPHARRPRRPGFTHPTKPIGRYLPAEQAQQLIEHGQVWEDRGEKGWRRVVASPEPLEVLDVGAVRALLAAGHVVVAAGGGGIPVVRDADGRLRGVEAVIDKDLTAALLARTLDADVLVIATDVDHAAIDWGTPQQRELGRVTLAEMRGYAADGQFAVGLHGPQGRGGHAVRRRRRAPQRHHLPGPHHRRRRGRLRHRHRTRLSDNRTRQTEPVRRQTAGPPADREERTVPDAIEVRKVPLHSVSDASELGKLIDDGVMDADRVIAVIGKTEGNGGVNDYTRIIADRAFREILVAKGAPGRAGQGGADRLVRRHRRRHQPARDDLRDRARRGAEQTDEPRLTVGFAMREQLLPEDIGYVPMVEKVAAAVKVAMERAGITDPADVHYVQTKTPLLTIHTIRDAKSRGKSVWTEHTHESMDLSNGCTALGIAVALGEIEMPTDADVMHNRDLYSSVASCSSGVELDQAQVVVVGNARGVGGRYRIGHSVMQDALDQDGIWAAIKDAGLDLPERPHRSDLDGRLVNVFLKCEASLDGQVAGRRNAMLDDSDVHWHRQIKSCVGGVTASVTGDPAVFVSVSAAHQGPDGGGPVAAIVDLGEGEPTGYRPPTA